MSHDNLQRDVPQGENSQRDVSIQQLPAIVTLLFERAQRPLVSEAHEPFRLFVRYLRRKPGRGLAVIYQVDPVQPSSLRRTQATDPRRFVSLTLKEQALEGTHIRFSITEAQHAPLKLLPSGVLQAEDLGLSVQAFPADSGLPALAMCCETSPSSAVFQALQSAARLQLGDTSCHLITARAEPVRYKPANRCVLRYHLTLTQSSADASPQRELTLFGKVYADPHQACVVQALQQQLYDEQVHSLDHQGAQPTHEPPLLPRPLSIIGNLGLTFNEAVQPASAEEPLLPGTRVLRPHLKYNRAGEVTSMRLPDEELRLTARALARLHTSAVRPSEGTPRTGAKEARRVRERAALIAEQNPLQAQEIEHLAEQLAFRLEALQPDTYRPAHGGFKASQLLFHSHHVFVVDFDGFCLADAALDVGYFLAYLRPSGRWYHRAGLHDWFESAAAVFVRTYRQAMQEHGIDQDALEGIVERSRFYEAALLFKIATRRVNRLNSPRPGELAAMLHDIAACLTNRAR